MLVRFKVGNFLSFNEIQEFSLIKGKTQKKPERVFKADKLGKLKLLKFAAIYGANASGKSNLISAIKYAQKIIVENKNKKFTNLYFKLIPENSNKPSYFEFEIIINKICYSYGFEIVIKENRIVSEWLIEIKPNGKPKKIFERNIEESTFISDLKLNENIQKIFDVYSDEFKHNNEFLFLFEMNRAKNELYKNESEINIIKDLFLFFKEKLTIRFPNTPISPFNYFYDYKDEKDKEEINRIIKAFGTGITDFKQIPFTLEKLKNEIPKNYYKEIENLIEDGKKIPKIKGFIYSYSGSYLITVTDNNIKVEKTLFNHGTKDKFELTEESDGTIRILELIEILLAKDKVIILDEIDRCLHPQLTYKFVDEFLKSVDNKNIQLVVTTHESRLLDFELLRQDEIWLTDKNTNGETSLYSLDEYNVRFDKKVDKAYLDGRYGGTPVFNSVFPIKEGYNED